MTRGANEPCAIVEALAQAVREQWARLQAGDWAGVAAHAGKTDELLLCLRSAADLPPDCRQRLAEVSRQHNDLCLAVAQRRQEMLRTLSSVGKRRALLRAYGRS